MLIVNGNATWDIAWSHDILMVEVHDLLGVPLSSGEDVEPYALQFVALFNTLYGHLGIWAPWAWEKGNPRVGRLTGHRADLLYEARLHVSKLYRRMLLTTDPEKVFATVSKPKRITFSSSDTNSPIRGKTRYAIFFDDVASWQSTNPVVASPDT